jgi:hypothetical protein
VHSASTPVGARHATQAPLSWLLVALLTSVGPVFLVLAVSASVLQATFASTGHESARDPYFLYAPATPEACGAHGLPDGDRAAARPEPASARCGRSATASSCCSCSPAPWRRDSR